MLEHKVYKEMLKNEYEGALIAASVIDYSRSSCSDFDTFDRIVVRSMSNIVNFLSKPIPYHVVADMAFTDKDLPFDLMHDLMEKSKYRVLIDTMEVSDTDFFEMFINEMFEYEGNLNDAFTVVTNYYVDMLSSEESSEEEELAEAI